MGSSSVRSRAISHHASITHMISLANLNGPGKHHLETRQDVANQIETHQHVRHCGVTLGINWSFSKRTQLKKFTIERFAINCVSGQSRPVKYCQGVKRRNVIIIFIFFLLQHLE